MKATIWTLEMGLKFFRDSIYLDTRLRNWFSLSVILPFPKGRMGTTCDADLAKIMFLFLCFPKIGFPFDKVHITDTYTHAFSFPSFFFFFPSLTLFSTPLKMILTFDKEMLLHGGGLNVAKP